MRKSRRKGSAEGLPEARETAAQSATALATAPQSTGDTSAAAPDRDRIAMRAYERYLERGGTEGRALDDWLEAERELNATDDRDAE